MAKDLLGWALEQPEWVRDSLRRIASSTDCSLTESDLDCILDNVRAAAGSTASPHALHGIAASHLGGSADDNRRTVLAQLGPVSNVDRLADGQRLRLAPEGITLIYGENGSGKSGYTRIAKRLCRSLTADRLRGDVFKHSHGSKRVQVRYKVGDDTISEIEWDPDTPAPSQLRQISVFDSQNARLYVDNENRIAYLPREIAILEHHGEMCQKMSARFAEEEKGILQRLRVPLPAGYSPTGAVARMLGQLNPKAQSLPSEADIRGLAELSEAELDELTRLEAELNSDPGALAATRRRAVLLLTRVRDVLAELQGGLSASVEGSIKSARMAAAQAAEAETLVASAYFANEPAVGVGNPAWRMLFEAARQFVASGVGEVPDRLPETTGDRCPLCLDPLTPAGASRLTRFNDFINGEVAKRAEAARGALGDLLTKVQQISVPSVSVVEDSLVGYSQLGSKRGANVSEITRVLTAFDLRRAALINDTENPPAAPSLAAIIETVTAEISLLEEEANQLQQSASHTKALDAARTQLGSLRDRKKLALDFDTILQRLRDLEQLHGLKACQAQVATRPISTQITALRKLLVTEELDRRLKDEIRALDLTHLPFKVSDSSSGGKSLFSVGLQVAGSVKNNQVLSEGEQRALALACFLAEISGEDDRYGIIVDDPVSSLDHLRMRKVAKRLVSEAKKGRQVIIFTHNLVFFNEVTSEAARAGGAAPLLKSLVTKTQAEGFGVIRENCDPWGGDLKARIETLRQRTKKLMSETDFDTEEYRSKVKDFYSDLRETWERAVEEALLSNTVMRFVPDVKTQSLKEVTVTDEDYRTIFFAMKKASERSGHDMSAGRDIPQPFPDEMEADFKVLDEFKIQLAQRKKATSATRKALEQPMGASLL